MSYLYKKPTKRSVEENQRFSTNEYGKSSITEAERDTANGRFEVNEVVIPEEKVEKVDVIGLQGSAHITEISYEEHLKNLELMCKADRSFMARVRSFCEEHSEDNFPNVSESTSKSTSEYREECE